VPRSRSEPDAIRPSDSYVVAPSVDVRRYGDAVLVASMPVDHGIWVGPNVVRLSGTAVAVWDCLGVPRTVAQICDELARRFETPAPAIVDDVVAVLDDWSAARLVERR
jgi:Coenzyme PQQ synthesis protein D (PqqD)